MKKRNLVLFLFIVSYNSILLAQVLPDIPDLIRITVDHSDSGVLIQWQPSADTDIEFYNLYKMNQDLSFSHVSSINADTFQYKHMTSGLMNLAYTVTAEDSAGNESLFSGNIHKVVGVSAEFDPIASANKVTWSAYVGWEGNISGYRVYGGVAGAPMLELSIVQASTTSYMHTDVQADTFYTYYIETINTSGINSISPIDSVSTYTEGVRIENRNAFDIQIYPNPAYNYIILQIPDATNSICEILNSQGQIIQTLRPSWSPQQIDFSSFQKGVYFITIRSNDFVTTKKIIKL